MKILLLWPMKYPNPCKSVRATFFCVWLFLTTWFFTLDLKKADQLEFKDTSNTKLTGHPMVTTCRPDFIAAFSNHNNAWPFVLLTGEKASAGKSANDQKLQAITYLHYLILARPDLHVAQGLLTTKSEIMFVLGTGGVGVQTCLVKWDDKVLYQLLSAFIYRLYIPDDFADPSYIKADFDEKTSGATYTIRIKTQGAQEINCSGFNHIYARNPFSTRTHVFSNPKSGAKDGVVVIKDQLCRVGRRFNEFEILKRVHGLGRVPGVVKANCGEVVATPQRLNPQSLEDEGRRKCRLGLSESGSPFISIPTPQKMLETLFDLLEGI
jgi:hypothetical protein